MRRRAGRRPRRGAPGGATGSGHRAAVEVDERERVAGARRVVVADRSGGMSASGRPAITRAPSEPSVSTTSGTPRASTARASSPPARMRALVLVELQHREVREHGAVDVGVPLERADARAARFPARRAGAAGRRGRAPQRSVPGSASGGARRRAPSARRRAAGPPSRRGLDGVHVADGVDGHHAVVALVVEAERGRLRRVAAMRQGTSSASRGASARRGRRARSGSRRPRRRRSCAAARAA